MVVMDDNIRLRLKQLSDLQEDIKDVDKDITLILQCLQWDRKKLLQRKKMVMCKFDCNHRIPTYNIKKHEDKCYFKAQSYDEGELFLPEPLDANATTVVKFSTENVNDIICYAMQTDLHFKRSSNPSYQCQPSPLTLSRLQTTFTADERRAIHDAVVEAAPLTPHLEDISLPGCSGRSEGARVSRESRLQQQAALRDAHRRRVKHRRALATHRDELRIVIDAQMELLIEEQNTQKIENSNVGDDDDRRRGSRGSGDKHLKSFRKESKDNRDDYREKRKCEYDKEYSDERREKRRYDYHDNRQRNYNKDNIKIKQEKDMGSDGKSRYNRDEHGHKRKYEYDKKYTIKNAPREKERSYDYNDKCQRYNNKDNIKIKEEKDVVYDGPSREEREDGRDRRRGRDRSRGSDKRRRHKQEERRHRHESFESRGERSHERYYRGEIYERNNEHVKIKEEPEWDGDE